MPRADPVGRLGRQPREDRRVGREVGIGVDVSTRTQRYANHSDDQRRRAERAVETKRLRSARAKYKRELVIDESWRPKPAEDALKLLARPKRRSKSVST